MSSLHHKATFAAQKNFSSACFFMPFYLVNPNKCVTHTHTHSNVRSLIKNARALIYNIITYKQRVCKKFFINFLHALFACINERILYAKQGLNNSQHKMVLTK